MRDKYIIQAGLVLALALCFGAALAGVETTLKGRIEANKLAETRQQIPRLVPGAVSGQAETVAGRIIYRAVDGASRHVGWVIPAGGQGFADKIELLIGLDPAAETITGIYVLDQKETPGLGNNIVEADWRGQFASKPTAVSLAVTKGLPKAGNEISSITGATISSQSVCDIINSTIADLKDQLVEAARQ